MEEYYTVSQAAIVLKVHHLTIRRYIKEGQLKAYRVGGSVRISLNDLRAFTQTFVPNPKSSRSSQASQNKPGPPVSKKFGLSDSLFRLQARGLSMTKLE